MKMKFFYLISISFLILLGCVEKSAPEKVARNNNAKQATATKQNSKKDHKFDNKNLPTWKFAKFTMLGSTPIKKVRQPVKLGRDGLKLTGWALDRNLKQGASKVQIRVGGKVFEANTKRPTAYLAKAMNKAAYNNAGFNVKIPWAKLPKGEQTVEIIVHNAAGTKSTSIDKIKVTI